jgi:hypothetical protein
MKLFALAVTFAASLAGSALAAPVPAQSIAPFSSGPATSLLTNAAYYPYRYAGHRYCWYDDAWRGPGWYLCGYAFRRGYGWGGVGGWRGWGHEEFRGGEYRHGGWGDRDGGRGGRGGHDRGHDGGGHHR